MILKKKESAKKNVVIKKTSKTDLDSLQNAVSEDINLTWAAKGLLCYLLTDPKETISYKYLKESSFDSTEFIVAATELFQMGFIEFDEMKSDKLIKVIGDF